jgi:hypothetical protein
MCFLFICGVNFATGGLYDYDFVHLIACCNRSERTLAGLMPKLEWDSI